MSEQQLWAITFNGSADDANYQTDVLQEFLLNALPGIDVTQHPTNINTQGGWVDLLIALGGGGGALTAAIGAISLFFKSTHSASINIEIQEGQLTRFEAKNITSANFEQALKTVVDYVQSKEHGKEDKP